MRHNRDAITPVSRSPRLPAKMSMLIADRFVNSRASRVAFVRPRAGLTSPDTTFNYPPDARGVIAAANIKDFAPTTMHAARAAALASDSYLRRRSILSSSIRHATRADLEGFFIVVFIEFDDRAGTNRPGLISHQTGVIELIPARSTGATR